LTVNWRARGACPERSEGVPAAHNQRLGWCNRDFEKTLASPRGAAW